MFNFNVVQFREILNDVIQEVFQAYLEANGHLLSSHQNQLLTISEAAQFLDLSTQTLYRLASEKKIPHYKQGRLYFMRNELEDWVKEGRRKTQKEIRKEVLNY